MKRNVCHSIEGRLAGYMKWGLDICDFYECSVIDRKLRHCGECEEILMKDFGRIKPKMDGGATRGSRK